MDFHTGAPVPIMNLGYMLESYQRDAPDGGRAALIPELLPILDTAVGERRVWLLRSLNDIVLLARDDWQSPWFVTISPRAELDTAPYYAIAFQSRASNESWPEDCSSGLARSKERAAEMVAIAVELSGGWGCATCDAGATESSGSSSQDEALVTTAPLSPKLVLVDGAMAMDGGSLSLSATDPDGARVHFMLDWSIRSQMAGTTQFYVNGVLVPRRSPEEARWLARLRDAQTPGASPFRTSGQTPLSNSCLVLADDAADYLDAVKRGPEFAISHLAARLVALVSSAHYQDGHAPTAAPPPQGGVRPPLQDRVRSLLLEGRKMEALKLYREAHPDVGLMAARSAVDAMAVEIEHAPQPAAAADTAKRRG